MPTLVVIVMALAVALTGPASAAASSNVGAGTLTGSVSFAAPGVPPAGTPPAGGTCAPVSFTLSGTSDAVVYNTVIMGHAGTVSISGTGSSTCEATAGGSGTLVLHDVRGTGTTGSQIDCANPTVSPATTLTGGYARTGTDIEAVVGGTCKINGYAAAVLVTFHGTFVPSTPTVGTSPPGLTVPGLNAPITQATIRGAFGVQPA